MLQRELNEETVNGFKKNPDFVTKSFDERQIATRKNAQNWHIVYKIENERIIVLTMYFD